MDVLLAACALIPIGYAVGDLIDVYRHRRRNRA